jgi:hypothetical protein
MNTKLHPLHTPEYVAQYVLTHGEYPGSRCTGRSTALALEYVAWSIRVPGLKVVLWDHFDSTGAHECLKRAVEEIISRLDFRRFRITKNTSRAGLWNLTFGDSE